MNRTTKKTLEFGAKTVLTLALMSTVAAGYGAKITNSYMSGASSLANEFSGSNSKNIVAENAGKFVGKTVDATAKLWKNIRSRVGR